MGSWMDQWVGPVLQDYVDSTDGQVLVQVFLCPVGDTQEGGAVQFFIAGGSAELSALFPGGARGAGAAGVLGLVVLEDVVHKMA